MTGGTRRLVGLVTGWQTVASSCYYAPFAAAPFLSEAFGLSRFLVGVLVATLTLGYTLALVPSGALVDTYGERPAFVGGLAGLGGGALGVTVAPSTVLLFAAAFALGVAYATAMPATNRAIVAGVPADRQGLAIGLKQVGVTGGSALSALVVATAAPAVATWRTGLAALGLLAVLVAGLFAVGYAGSPAAGGPTLPDVGSLRGNRAYVALVAAGLCLGAGLFTAVGYLTLYLTESVGTTVAVAGAGFALAQVGGSAGRVGVGSAADRLGRRLSWEPARAATLLLAGQAGVGAVLLAALALSPSPALALLLVAGVGLTVFGFTGLYYTALSALVDNEEVGAATAGGQTTLNVGALLAPPAFGLLADTGSYALSWAVLAVVVLLGVGLVGLTYARLPDI
ncbi:MAG: MFS transporter [Haloarculaceae archaeon]